MEITDGISIPDDELTWTFARSGGPGGQNVNKVASKAVLRWNLAANFVGSGWTAVARLLCVPLYVQLLGMEAYGLIGFYVTLRAALLVLDLGLATTVNRAMARLSMDPGQAQPMRDLPCATVALEPALHHTRPSRDCPHP